MKSKTENIIGAIIGAIALNAIHEVAKKTIPQAPRINEVGNEGIIKSAEAVGISPPSGKVLDGVTFAFNILTNAMSYRMIGNYNRQHLLLLGTLHGLAVGLATLSLSKTLNLNDRPVTRTWTTQLLTLGWYAIGGFATAATVQILRTKKSRIFIS